MKITEAILQAAARLEALAKIRTVKPKQNRMLAFTNPRDFDKATWVSPDSETASFVSKHGDLLFVIIY